MVSLVLRMFFLLLTPLSSQCHFSVSLNKDPFYTAEKEIEELSKLIPEIKEKIADTEDMAKESVKRIGDKMLMEGEVETAVLGDAPKEETAGKTANGKGGKSSNGFGKENGGKNRIEFDNFFDRKIEMGFFSLLQIPTAKLSLTFLT